MYNLISRYMKNLQMEDVNSFASRKNINLSHEELEFTYVFIKKNWEQILGNPKLLNLDRYKNNFSTDNFFKIKKLVQEYSSKYQMFLK